MRKLGFILTKKNLFYPKTKTNTKENSKTKQINHFEFVRFNASKSFNNLNKF